MALDIIFCGIRKARKRRVCSLARCAIVPPLRFPHSGSFCYIRGSHATAITLRLMRPEVQLRPRPIRPGALKCGGHAYAYCREDKGGCGETTYDPPIVDTCRRVSFGYEGTS
jgi:hypothetical protein